MVEQPRIVSDFKKQLRDSIEGETQKFTNVQIPQHRTVYSLGDQGEMVYFIESGQIKLLMPSLEGKECLLDIHTEGDTFGELCLTGTCLRHETAMAMKDTTLKRIPCATFFLHLANHSLVEGFVQYLATRIAEQQQLISHLITADSEHRLGETLLMLARKLGQPDPRSKRIEHKITHEELSQMVGTTRPRITEFMSKFRGLDLIEVSPEHFLIVHEKKLTAYLAKVV